MDCGLDKVRCIFITICYSAPVGKYMSNQNEAGIQIVCAQKEEYGIKN
jgi:hypothetical protein